MKQEMTITEALERCARFGVKPGLDMIGTVCAVMGNPQDSLRVIHVAGTNGKGAVCALIDSTLRAAGFRTGRYTSPHLVSLLERFFIDGAPVQESKLESAFRRINHQPTILTHQLTYFELLTATAFELYRQEHVDYLVLETGLGGRLDATNIVKRPEVCVITRIGLDHCDWLGHTIAEIAAEKGGIIKPDVPVVLGAMPAEARTVLERIAAERHSPCIYAPEAIGEGSVSITLNSQSSLLNPQPTTHNSSFTRLGPTSPSTYHLPNLSLGGLFNRENAVTAMAALNVLGIGCDAIERGFSNVIWPGRYQRIEKGGSSFLVDGAHNPPAMRALVDSLKAEAPQSEGGFAVHAAICGFCGDKEVAGNLKILHEVVDEGIAVPIRNPRSLPHERVAELMRETGFGTVRDCASLEDALSIAPTGTVVCGSLFLAGEALELLGAMQCHSSLAVPNETFPQRQS